MSEAVQQITPYEEFYEYMLQKVDMIPTSVERENFIGIWTPVLKTMCEARFSAQPVVFDILKLSLLYATRKILTDSMTIDNYKDLFIVRDYLKESTSEDTLPFGTEMLYEDICMKISQSCESLLGQESDIPALRPNLSSPDQLFYESYKVALMIYENN
mgnify:CR=1 FL=1|jgi:hypothetical protein